VPVIFLSARGMSREIEKGFACGEMVVDYLVKPIAPDELVRRVERVLVGIPKRGVENLRNESLAQLVHINLPQ